MQLTNEDKSRQLETKAHKALLVGIARDWKAAELAAKEAGKQTVVGINKLRSCGEKLKELCGHEQIGMDFYMRVQAQLPKTMRYASAKAAVHVANRLKEDVKTVQEAFVVQRDLFTAMMEYKEPKRLEAQTAHEYNPWNEFVSGAASFTRMFDELKTDAMQSWGRDQLDTFIRATEPIVKQHETAVKLRGEK